ncbi:elongation factor Tu, mitochondrial [Tanacetum coccineum]
MQKPSYNSGKWQRPLNYSYGQSNKWHQSENLGRPPRRIVQTEFIQRKNKRDKEERFGKCDDDNFLCRMRDLLRPTSWLSHQACDCSRVESLVPLLLPHGFRLPHRPSIRTSGSECYCLQVIAQHGSVEVYTKFEVEICVHTKDESGGRTIFFSNYISQFYFRMANVTEKVDLLENINISSPGMETVSLSFGT